MPLQPLNTLCTFYPYANTTSIPSNINGIKGMGSVFFLIRQARPQTPDSITAVHTVFRVNHPPVHNPRTAAAIPSPYPILSFVMNANSIKIPPGTNPRITSGSKN